MLANSAHKDTHHRRLRVCVCACACACARAYVRVLAYVRVCVNVCVTVYVCVFACVYIKTRLMVVQTTIFHYFPHSYYYSVLTMISSYEYLVKIKRKFIQPRHFHFS